MSRKEIISIHALLAESDGFLRMGSTAETPFLSTLSLRRATTGRKTPPLHGPNFYPRSPCGERRPRGIPGDWERNISIHALLAESDHIRQNLFCFPIKFLSTLSLRRATSSVCLVFLAKRFLSTLSLRRATSSLGRFCTYYPDFYPRSPCGERHGKRDLNPDS